MSMSSLTRIAFLFQNLWHETADYGANQFDFKMGTLLDRPSDKNAMQITNRKGEVVWSTPIEATSWQNFAVTLDFENKYVSNSIMHDLTYHATNFLFW